MKIIKRLDLDTNEECLFKNVGLWANGLLAYSKVDKDGNALSDYDDSTYIQTRYQGRLCMYHI